MAGLVIASPSIVAQLAMQADLSVSAIVSPPYFVQEGRHTVALTVRNAGPDNIDSGADFSIAVFGDFYTITTQLPPYDVLVN